MNKLFKIFMFVLLVTIMTGCGSWGRSYEDEKFYVKQSITNETGILTLWSGGKIMAVFHKMKIIYSAVDSDAIYFVDKKGSTITLTDTNGDHYSIEGTGDTWYSSPGVLLKIED